MRDPMIDTRRDPAQPSRFVKKKNILSCLQGAIPGLNKMSRSTGSASRHRTGSRAVAAFQRAADTVYCCDAS